MSSLAELKLAKDAKFEKDLGQDDKHKLAKYKEEKFPKHDKYGKYDKSDKGSKKDKYAKFEKYLRGWLVKKTCFYLFPDFM